MTLKDYNTLLSEELAREDSIIKLIKYDLSVIADEDNEMQQDLLKETDRDKFFTKLLAYNQQAKDVKTTVTGTKRRRINVWVDGVKVPIPGYVWNEINEYDLTPENKQQLAGYGWEVAGSIIIDKALSDIGLKDGLMTNYTTMGSKKKVDFRVDLIYGVHNFKIPTRGDYLGIDMKSNIYNFAIGSITGDSVTAAIEDYQKGGKYNFYEYMKLHILNKKYSSSTKPIVFFSVQNGKEALTLGTVIQNHTNLHFNKELTNDDIVKMAIDEYTAKKDYYDNMGANGSEIVHFFIEGMMNRRSADFEKDIIEQSIKIADKSKLKTTLWYGTKRSR